MRYSRSGMLEQLLHKGWSYHDTDSARLARELEMAGEVPPPLLADFLQLALHTLGEHLGDWPRALALGRQALVGHAPDAPTWARLAVAAIMAGDPVCAATLELEGLTVAADPLAHILAIRLELAQAMVGAGRAEAAAPIFRRALDLAVRPPIAPALDRVLAATSNNIAWSLHDLPARSPDQDALMQLAADTSLAAWRRCGDWLNEEQALHLAATIAGALGTADQVLALTRAGLDVIAAHGRRPFDTARLHLLRARAFATLHDAAGHAQSLAAADAAAAEIAIEALKPQYAAARARVAGEPP